MDQKNLRYLNFKHSNANSHIFKKLSGLWSNKYYKNVAKPDNIKLNKGFFITLIIYYKIPHYIEIKLCLGNPLLII